MMVKPTFQWGSYNEYIQMKPTEKDWEAIEYGFFQPYELHEDILTGLTLKVSIRLAKNTRNYLVKIMVTRRIPMESPKPEYLGITLL